MNITDTNINLDYLNNNDNFINSLSKVGLKKSNMELSTDYETFLNKPCRFMFISDIKANELETPKYLLLQIYDNNKWANTKCYKINDDINKFYDQLSSKTIEITDSEGVFVYDTSIGGNEWTLTSNNENDSYKKVMRKEELDNIVNTRKAKIKVV